jgi:hypothetical protein
MSSLDSPLLKNGDNRNSEKNASILDKLISSLIRFNSIFALLLVFASAGYHSFLSYGTSCPKIPEFSKPFMFPSNYALIEIPHTFYTALEIFPTSDEGDVVGGSLGKISKFTGFLYDFYSVQDSYGNQRAVLKNAILLGPKIYVGETCAMSDEISRSRVDVIQKDWVRKTFCPETRGESRVEWTLSKGTGSCKAEMKSDEISSDSFKSNFVTSDFMGKSDFWRIEAENKNDLVSLLLAALAAFERLDKDK